jgi:nicotinamidase-related amidase
MCVPAVQKEIEKLPNIESIVLFGLESHICVEQTALELLATEKYSVHIVADCVLSRSQEDRMLALERLRSCGCIITTSENVIFKLMKDKEHPKFNEVRKLVTDPSFSTGLCNKL